MPCEDLGLSCGAEVDEADGGVLCCAGDEEVRCDWGDCVGVDGVRRGIKGCGDRERCRVPEL